MPDASSAPRSSGGLNEPVWAEPWEPLAPLEGETTADVCVVGLGGSGMAAITEALDKGLDVVGVDAGSVAGEAAGRNGGFLLAGPEKSYHQAIDDYGHAAARDFYRLTVDEIARMAAADPDAVRRVGSLRVATAPGERTDVSTELAARAADGFDVEPYSGAEGAGFLVPGDAAMNPMRRVQAVARRALRRGARLYERSRVVSLLPGRVATSTGSVVAGITVVAVDGTLERLVPSLAGRVKTARLQMLATAPAPEVSFSRPVYAEWGYVYWQQLPDGRVALGGFRQRHEAAEWTAGAGPTPAVQADLDAHLVRLGVRAPVTHRWAGHSAYTLDRRPIFEEIHPGTVVVGGYSGHGNVTGSLYGREAVRYLVTGRRTYALLS